MTAEDQATDQQTAPPLPPGYEPEVTLPPGLSADVSLRADPSILENAVPAGYTINGIPVYKKGTPGPVGAGPGAPGAAGATPPAAQPEPPLPPGYEEEKPGVLEQLWQEGVVNPSRQVGAGIFDAAAGAQHITSNVFDMLDKTAQHIANLTGTTKGDAFKNIADWAKANTQGAEQTAQDLSGGRRDIGSQIFRGLSAGTASLPTMGIASTAGGPVGGFAALGVLEQEDKGFLPALEGAVQGGLLGGTFHVLSPAGQVLKLPLNALLGYTQARMQGADPKAAIANATTMALLPEVPGAVAGMSDVAKAGRARLFPPRTVSPESAAAQDVIRLGQKYNVPLTAGDISQSPALKNMEVSLEKVPGAGMQKLREGQQEDARAAAAGMKSLYEEKLLDTDQSSIDELQNAAQAGDERARNVMEKMQEAGNDPDRIIQASIGLGDWTTRQTAKELYDHVQKLAEEHNLGDVPLDSTGKAIGSALQQLRPAKLPNKEVIRLLQQVKESITPETDNEGKPVVDEHGNPIKPDNSYGLIRQLHSDLGERIREYYQGNNALIGEKGVGYLERVQNAIEDDMRNYAQNSNVPEIVDAGRAADGYYKSARVPYKNGMLASAATSNEPDQIFQQFIKAGKGDRAQNFYSALDDKGRAAVRYNMVAKAVDDAINPQSGIFSPQKFFTAVDKLDDAYGVFFNAKDKAEIQGFKKLMGHVTRAGQYAENPPTGQRVIPYLIAGAAVPAAKVAMAHPLIAGGGVAALGMMRALFTTTRGRDLLLRLNGIKPGTPVADSVWQQVGREMPKLMQKPPEEPPEGPPSGGGPSSGPPAPTGGNLADTLQGQR